MVELNNIQQLMAKIDLILKVQFVLFGFNTHYAMHRERIYAHGED